MKILTGFESFCYVSLSTLQYKHLFRNVICFQAISRNIPAKKKFFYTVVQFVRKLRKLKKMKNSFTLI